jgi:hypothetical protein
MQQQHFAGTASIPMERPVLSLGLVGFTAEQEARLGELVAGPWPSLPSWRLGNLSDADAWWVNGSRTQVLADGNLRIASGVPGGRSVRFSLAEIDRPIAFSQPLAPADFEPAYHFNMEAIASMHQVLTKFGHWLRPLASQLCLASQLIGREKELGSRVYHVSVDGRLLAVVDLQGDVGVLPTAAPTDFDHAEWQARPESARYVPEGFRRVSMPQLVWQYAVRSSRDLLPVRYRVGRIYFRRPPRLDHHLLKDSHLLLMRELAQAPGAFEELQYRTGLAAGPLARELAALYLVGSITSNPRRAPARYALPRQPGLADDTSGSPHSDLPSRPGPAPLQPWIAGPHHMDNTAPAPMRTATR